MWVLARSPVRDVGVEVEIRENHLLHVMVLQNCTALHHDQRHRAEGQEMLEPAHVPVVSRC